MLNKYYFYFFLDSFFRFGLKELGRSMSIVNSRRELAVLNTHLKVFASFVDNFLFYQSSNTDTCRL